ncbi:hypothetical protein BH11BAC5_BH11BAC5_09790 [soil metagenome]
MEEDILTLVPEGKIFKKKTILICTILTGPLVAGYMIAENFKALGEKSNQVRTFVIASIFTIGSMVSIIDLPQLEKIPNFIFSIFYIITASACVQFLQVDKIRLYISNGGTFHGPERAIVASVLCLIVTIAIAVVIIVITSLLQL